MFCRNCGKDIGNQSECSFCGFCPELDSNPQRTTNPYYSVKLPQTEIKPLKTTNRAAITGFIMSILSFCPLPFMIIAIVQNIKGSLRCKAYRSGKAFCVWGWILLFFWIAFYALYIYAMASGSMYM